MVKVITLVCVTNLVFIVEAAFDSIASDMSVERSMCGEPVHEFHPLPRNSCPFLLSSLSLFIKAWEEEVTYKPCMMLLLS